MLEWEHMMRWTSICVALVSAAVCATLLVQPASRVAHAAGSDQQPVVTITGDVRTPLNISVADIDALPLSSFSRSCADGRFQRYIGVDVLGLVDAAAPLTSDLWGFSVQITGAGGESVTLPASALDPLISPDHPNGPLLAVDDPYGPLSDADGPFFLESGDCDHAKDVPDVQSIVVSVTNQTTNTTPSVDDSESLFEAALQAGDLPDLAPKYIATRATIPPRPDLATLHFYGYWAAGAAHIDESVLTYTDADEAANQVVGFDPAAAIELADCDSDSLQTLPALGLGDEDIAYTFRCPGSAADTADASDTVVAVDLFRIGRVVGSVSVALPAPAEPSATLRTLAPIAAGRLGAVPQ
jgi:hypothetical protein